VPNGVTPSVLLLGGLERAHSEGAGLAAHASTGCSIPASHQAKRCSTDPGSLLLQPCPTIMLPNAQCMTLIASIRSFLSTSAVQQVKGCAISSAWHCMMSWCILNSENSITQLPQHCKAAGTLSQAYLHRICGYHALAATLCAVTAQAVVRGRKLRQQLSQARQAAAYTDDTLRPDSHDAELDMDDMDEFLASLPDDEPSPAQSVASSSSPTLANASGSTLAGGAGAPAAPHQVLPLSQLADARRSSHASASTSGGSHTSSSLPLYHHAAGFPMAFPHSSRGHTDASVAAHTSGAVRESPQRSHSTSAWGPQSSVGTVTQTVHRSLSAAETPNSTGAFMQHPPGQQTSSGRPGRHGSQQQQQQEPFLPVLTGSHGAAQMHMASVPGLAMVSTTHTGSRISLPPIQESPNEPFTGPVDPNSVGSSYSGLAAATATAVGGCEEDSQEAARGGDSRSARVSRASSSVRSEQSVGSQSPDKAAAKQERHKVGLCMPSLCKVR